MKEKTKIHAGQLVREIRDRQAELFAEKSRSEIIAFFAQAGEVAREEARRKREAITGVNEARRHISRAERSVYDEIEDSKVRD